MDSYAPPPVKALLRPRGPLAWAWVGWVLVACGGPSLASVWTDSEIPLQVRSQLTTAERQGPTLVWLFRPEDCLQCKGFLADVRVSQRRSSDAGMQFVAIFSGDAIHLSDMHRIIARERVNYRLAVADVDTHEIMVHMGFRYPVLLGVYRDTVRALMHDDTSVPSAAMREFIASSK